MIDFYGQRYIPEIIIHINDKKYSISDYYQDYLAIHHLNEPSEWIIKVALLPEGLKESLCNDISYLSIIIKETHRNCETNEDTTKKYFLLHPDIIIEEQQDCLNDGPISYTITITGKIK